MATIQRARQGAQSHVLRVNPSLGDPDYLIVYQCGFILRLFENLPGRRFDFAGTGAGRDAVSQMVRRSGQLAAYSETVRDQLTSQFLDGILTQVRSYPVGMRIDSWIYDAFPALRELQQAGIEKQLADNLGAISPEIRAMAPKQIYENNAAMNAAYASFAERLIGKSGHTIPYRAAGLEKKGRLLLRFLDEIAADAAGDQVLIVSWAQELGMSGWYQWLPAT